MIVYDILSALTGGVLTEGLSDDQAAAWMTDNSPLSLGDARVALSVALAGETLRCGQIHVRVKSLDPIAALDREIASVQESDRRLTHYRGLLWRVENEQAGAR